MTEVAAQVSEVAVPAVSQDEKMVDPSKYGDDTIAKATSAEPAAAKHKVKINGVEQEVELSKLIERYQKEEAADQKFKTASQAKAEAEAMRAEYAEIDKNPFAYAQKKGIDIHQLAEDILIEKLRWEQSSPDQKELAIERQKRIEYEKRIEELTEKDRQSANAQLEAKAAQQIDDDIGEALEMFKGDLSPDDVMSIATIQLSYHQADKPISAVDAAKIVKGRVDAALARRLKSMNVDQVRAILPKELMDGLRKADVETALAQDPLRSRKKPEQNTPTARSNKPVSTDQFFKQMDDKFRGR